MAMEWPGEGAGAARPRVGGGCGRQGCLGWSRRDPLSGQRPLPPTQPIKKIKKLEELKNLKNPRSIQAPCVSRLGPQTGCSVEGARRVRGGVWVI